MGTDKLMSDLALKAMADYPREWGKCLQIVQQRWHDTEFRRDLKAYTDVPGHVRDQHIEWFYAAQCHAALLRGDIGAFKIEIGAVPFEDKRMEDNHSILQAALSNTEFSAVAAQCYESDGHFEWSEPATATQFVKTRHGFNDRLIKLSPWCAPLEIGYTHGYRSFLHLLGAETALARWCYDEDFIRVFKVLPHAVEKLQERRAILRSPKTSDMAQKLIQDAIEQLTLWN